MSGELRPKQQAALRAVSLTSNIYRRGGRQPAARSLLAPRRKRVVEGALAGRALFYRDDGAGLVGIDQRHVEPRTLLQELDVARAVGIDVGQPDQEEAVGDLDGEAGERRAAGLLVRLHQDARHVADAAAGKILRQDEGQLGGVTGRQRGVRVATE